MSEIYKSKYTGEEIDEKLSAIDNLQDIIANCNSLRAENYQINRKINELQNDLYALSSTINNNSGGEEEEGSSVDEILLQQLNNRINTLNNAVYELPIYWNQNLYNSEPILIPNDAEAIIETFYCVKYKNIVMFKVKWRNKNPIIVDADGNITDLTIFNINPSSFRPASFASGFSDGNNQGIAFYSIYNSGEIKLTSCGAPGRTIGTGNDNDHTFWFTATYICEGDGVLLNGGETMSGYVFPASDEP